MLVPGSDRTCLTTLLLRRVL